MKYVVVCYAIHDKAVASCDMFNTEEDAMLFMLHDAHGVYDEETEQGNDAVIEDNGDSMYVSSCKRECEWTWNICIVR